MKLTKINQMITLIGNNNPMQEKYLNEQISILCDEDILELENTIEYFEQNGYNVESLSLAYLLFVEDTVREQIYFYKKHEYRCHSFKEVADNVYYNDQYMSKYMLGLTLSTILWKTNRELFQWFISKIKDKSGNNYLEVGLGNGHYMFKAMKYSNYNLYKGVDISQTSISGANKYLSYFMNKNNINKKYILECSDFLKSEIKPLSIDCFVMGEVLEHVEEPLLFLKKAYDIVLNESYVFISTVINAPAIDHIYLFRNKEELFKLVNEAGFSVDDYICVTSNNSTLEKAEKKSQPITIALILKKPANND